MRGSQLLREIRENREMAKKKLPVRENTGNLETLPNHRENTWNFVWGPSINYVRTQGEG